jgi:hypothetical protein
MRKVRYHGGHRGERRRTRVYLIIKQSEEVCGIRIARKGNEWGEMSLKGFDFGKN